MGASQSTTFTFASLGITNANQRALIVNLARPGSENPPSVTTALSPLVTSANLECSHPERLQCKRRALEQHTTAAGQTLNQFQGGVGGSGLVFGPHRPSRLR